MGLISEHTGELDGLPIYWRSSPSQGTPALYLHGAPSSSDDWLDFLVLGGGVAPDLPGFGRTGKPGYLTFTIAEYAGFLERFLDMLGLERVHLVAHDWGVVGLRFAQDHPERVGRIVLIDAVPLFAGFEWHRAARIWRTPLVGEFVMGATTRRVLARATRHAGPDGGPLPAAWLESVLSHFDQGTQRAMLRLHRSATPEALAQAGEDLGALAGPSLVVWGERDGYVGAEWAAAYAAALGHAEVLMVAGAGHWPWIEHPEVIARVVSFVSDAAPGS